LNLLFIVYNLKYQVLRKKEVVVVHVILLFHANPDVFITQSLLNRLNCLKFDLPTWN